MKICIDLIPINYWLWMSFRALLWNLPDLELLNKRDCADFVEYYLFRCRHCTALAPSIFIHWSFVFTRLQWLLFWPTSQVLNESIRTHPQYWRTSKIESTSKLIINLNAVTIKATIITLVSFCLRLSSELILRMFLLSSVRSCKRGSISEMINS